ncbi:MAG TPA: hypothetical protein VN442_08595, partial [Bryobacteraceae bacterium]|nr:hypothetical protein [Bryobacteraceae bacterium]
MNFYQKYELLAPLPSGEIKRFRAQEVGGGRNVIAHLMVAGRTPANEALLAALAGLTGEHRAHIIETGDHEGTPYVITDPLPGGLTLEEWVKAAAVAAPPPTPAASKPPDEKLFTRAGAWKVPSIGEKPAQKPASSPAPPSQPKPAAPGVGEFTWMFQSPAAGESQPAAQPGEITRTMQRPAPPPPPESARTAPSAVPLETAPQPLVPGTGGMLQQDDSIPPPSTEPETPAPAAGEFTRMFQAPLASKPEAAPTTQAPAPPPPPAPEPAAPTAGEFTRMFQAPVAPKATAAPAIQVPPPPVPQPATGEFTPMFQAPVAPKATAAPAVQVPPPPVPQAAAPTAGEFTRMFQPPVASKPEAAPATQAAPPPPPPAPEPATGEFTPMFQAPV